MDEYPFNKDISDEDLLRFSSPPPPEFYRDKWDDECIRDTVKLLNIERQEKLIQEDRQQIIDRLATRFLIFGYNIAHSGDCPQLEIWLPNQILLKNWKFIPKYRIVCWFGHDPMNYIRMNVFEYGKESLVFNTEIRMDDPNWQSALEHHIWSQIILIKKRDRYIRWSSRFWSNLGYFINVRRFCKVFWPKIKSRSQYRIESAMRKERYSVATKSGDYTLFSF